MKNKIFKFLGFLFLMMVIVNVILSIISTFLPVRFESLILFLGTLNFR